MKFQKIHSADKERRIWEKLMNGIPCKVISYDEGVSLGFITHVKEAFPLFCGLPKNTGPKPRD